MIVTISRYLILGGRVTALEVGQRALANNRERLYDREQPDRPDGGVCHVGSCRPIKQRWRPLLVNGICRRSF